MAEMTGYAGKIARVDLSTGNITTVETPVDVLKKFLGGSALGVYYLFKEGIVDPAVTPFDAKNMVQFLVGPMNGFAPNARSTIVTKSAYNFISIATSGGRAAAELIQRRLEKPEMQAQCVRLTPELLPATGRVIP